MKKEFSKNTTEVFTKVLKKFNALLDATGFQKAHYEVRTYPRLPIRIIADSLYPSETLIKLFEEENMTYMFVLKDRKIKTLYKEFLALVSVESENRIIQEKKKKMKMIVNGCG